VTLIEDHQKNYIVIGLCEVSDSRVKGKYYHSIIINVNAYNAKFNMDNLMAFLQGSKMESINDHFVNSDYFPWRNSTTKSNATKLRMIFQSLDRYALANVLVQPMIGHPATQDQR